MTVYSEINEKTGIEEWFYCHSDVESGSIGPFASEVEAREIESVEEQKILQATHDMCRRSRRGGKKS